LPLLQAKIIDYGGTGYADIKILGFIPEVNFSFILPFICFIVIAIYGYRTYKKLNKQVA
jgi:FHS family L-fucose permease-like MFS transporter